MDGSRPLFAPPRWATAPTKDRSVGRQVRIYVFQGRDIVDILLGRARLRDMPLDGQFAGFHFVGCRLGIGIYSKTFAPLPYSAEIPQVTPWIVRPSNETT